MKNVNVIILGLLIGSQAFASAPEWTKDTHRQVVAGDIVHWGTGEARTSEIALFKARHMAIGTLIEECGGIANKDIIPRKQYIEPIETGYRAFALVSLDFSSCDNAKRPGSLKHPEALENPKIAEGQKLYKELLGGDTGLDRKEYRAKMKETEKRIKEFLLQEADIRTDQVGQLKEDIHRLQMEMKHMKQPVAQQTFSRAPASSSEKANCMREYRSMMNELQIASGDFNGNMGAPELSGQFGRAMRKKNMCMRMK